MNEEPPVSARGLDKHWERYSALSLILSHGEREKPAKKTPK
jgi:hypothetical protein